MPSAAGGTSEAPVWRVVRGDPDRDQLAALAAVLAAVAAVKRSAVEAGPEHDAAARTRWRREHAYRPGGSWRTAVSDTG